MSKVITKGGYCSKRNKIMGFQFLGADGKFALGGSYGATGDIVASPEALPSELTVSPTYKGCKLCGNKYAYVCPACGTVVCSDGTAKNNASCPSCGSVLNISAVRGNLLAKPVLVRKASFKVNDGEASENGPYTKWAGVSKIEGAAADKFGNAQGSQYDLARDGGFHGQKIVICTSLDYARNNLNYVNAALKKKGFTVQNLAPHIPSPHELKRILNDANQFWLISQQKLGFVQGHVEVLRDFFESGHGLYLWGDNDPLNTDVNFVAGQLFPGTFLSGDYVAEKVLSIQKRAGEPGIVGNHLISTGITSFYEGTSISKIQYANGFTPLVYSSDRNIVTVYYDHGGKRAMIDGAFTRLWDQYGGKTAGTDRYIVNAAAWLANVERFGF